jgi:hypothetical protein
MHLRQGDRAVMYGELLTGSAVDASRLAGHDRVALSSSRSGCRSPNLRSLPGAPASRSQTVNREHQDGFIVAAHVAASFFPCEFALHAMSQPDRNL